ncbi:MAG: ATP-dependent DNA helicase RecG [Candidatus Gracilibacteria bacterium]
MLLTKTLLHTTDNYIKALEKVGITTVNDLINHYPRDYEDRTNVLDTFSYLNLKEKNTILVTLISIDTTRTQNGKTLTKAILEDKSGFMSEAVWFNKKYFPANVLASKGKKVLVSGKVKYDYGKVTFMSPDIETDLTKVSGEIVPIYPDINYLPGTWIASKIPLLKSFFDEIEETLPESIIKKYNFIEKKEALKKLHFPKNKHDIEIAKFRLAYEELFEINFKTLSKKFEVFKETEGKSLAIPLNPELIKDILSKLPFSLTNGQKVSLFQTLKDMEKNHSMQRLLEGDVGTGKTIIALILAIHGIIESKNSIQVAFMVPTEILARQHFEAIQELLSYYNLTSNLLVGSTKTKEKEEIKNLLKTGNIDIIVGTHALIQENVYFNNLGFVVVDEQHRFGVKQREILESGIGNKSGLVPHVLNMTATPIPRTLALTLYGDQDLSVIKEYPAGRKLIHTKVAKSEAERQQIELFVRTQIEAGRQVFWISPLVEESEKIDLANAISTFEFLQDIYQPFKVGLLHGKMKPKEKEAIMKDFSENKIAVLSSTSVVEVGVNIPNATIMCIEGAERFGLSQLHQFRGRVGRGGYQSYCYLFPSKGNYTDRLKAMERTNNGFELAEIDLELRGPGEVYGVKQSGLPDLKIADLKDLELVSQIREDIEEMLKN